jgi:hypothetical protein
MEPRFVKELPMGQRLRARSAVWQLPLMQHPGQWAVIREGVGNSSAAGTLTRVHGHAGFEFASRKQPDGTYVVYGRFVGNGAKP